MKFTAAALFSALVSAVVAQSNAGIAINLPSIGEVLTAGTTFTITWTVNATSSSTNINSIALMSGDSAALTTDIQNILSAPIPVNPPTYAWAIPATVTTMPSYVLAFAGDNGATTYSTYFTIIGAAPGTNTTVASSTAAVASSRVTATSSAASSASNATASATTTAKASAANNLKAGLAGVAGVAGAVALLL